MHFYYLIFYRNFHCNPNILEFQDVYKKILIIISKYISIKFKKYYFLLTKFLIKILTIAKISIFFLNVI